jgi:Flp pilus assembly protein TadG
MPCERRARALWQYLLNVTPGLGLSGLGGVARDLSGQTIVETALVLPTFVLVIFGLAQFSILLLSYCNASYACRMAVRYASVHSTQSLAPMNRAQLQSMVNSQLFLGSAITPTVTPSYCTATLVCNTTNTIGNLVLVTVSWNQTLKIPYIRTITIPVSTQELRVITR